MRADFVLYKFQLLIGKVRMTDGKGKGGEERRKYDG
jgi:hypothetical protein